MGIPEILSNLFVSNLPYWMYLVFKTILITVFWGFSNICLEELEEINEEDNEEITEDYNEEVTEDLNEEITEDFSEDFYEEMNFVF